MKPLIAAVALISLAVISDAQAQSYPNRAVTIIVPFAAGGAALVAIRSSTT